MPTMNLDQARPVSPGHAPGSGTGWQSGADAASRRSHPAAADLTAGGTRARPPSFRRRWGWLAALHHSFVQRLSRSLGLHIYGIYIRPIEQIVGPDPIVPGFCFRLYQPGEAVALLADATRPELELTEVFVRKAFDKGDVCEAILFNGEIVSFSWSAFSPTHVQDGVHVVFDDRHRYAYFAFTLPEYRGRHLPRLFKPFRDRHCVSRGCTHSISYISVDNHSSVCSARAAGNRRIGFAGYLKRGALFFAFHTSKVRESGFRFFLPAALKH
jgi:hypothetical protein